MIAICDKSGNKTVLYLRSRGNLIVNLLITKRTDCLVFLKYEEDSGFYKREREAVAGGEVT